MMNIESNHSCPLEPPGTIAVIGGGIVGVEAALYGRYLGYNVHVFQSGKIGQSMLDRGDEPLDMLPDRSFSPLAAAALSAQVENRPQSLPTTCRTWAQSILLELCQGDLLADNIHVDHRVVAIGQVPVEWDEEDAADPDFDPESIPADFQLMFEDHSIAPFRAESVLLATRDIESIGFDFPVPTDYLFDLRDVGQTKTHGHSSDAEVEFVQCLRRITQVYANLGQRADLDLYRPRRL
jgi:hypothetical protein